MKPARRLLRATISAGGLTNPIAGDSTILPAPPHPADDNPPDFVMSSDEVGDYNAAWRTGSLFPVPPNPIPISYLTRAGFLWMKGGDYQVSTNSPTPCPPLIWVPGGDPSGANGSASGLPGGNQSCWPTGQVCAVSSWAPTNFIPGIAFTVTLAVTPPSNTQAYAVLDLPPESRGR